MCQIFVKKDKSHVGRDIAQKLFEDTYSQNPDGFGWVCCQGNAHKTLDIDIAREVFLSQEWEIFHFRKATTGKILKENCHPFECEKGYLFHNGTAFQTQCGTPDSAIIAKSSDLLSELDRLSQSNRFAIYHKKQAPQQLITLHGAWLDGFNWWVANAKYTSQEVLSLIKKQPV